jgi:hypothetical protein
MPGPSRNWGQIRITRSPTAESLQSKSCQLHGEGSGNPTLAISRGSPQRAARTHRHGRWFPGMLLSPSPFRSGLSHQTQEYPPNSFRLHREYNRAPRGAGWSLAWSWFAAPLSNAGSTTAIRIMDDTVTLEIDSRDVAIARISERAGVSGPAGPPAGAPPACSVSERSWVP